MSRRWEHESLVERRRRPDRARARARARASRCRTSSPTSSVGRLGERGGRAAAARQRPPRRAPTSSATCREDVTASRRSALSIADPFGLAETSLTLDDAAGARRLPAPRRARPALLRRRRRSRARPAPAAAAARRLRPPQRSRLPAGRVAAPRPLAVDGTTRLADGEGARGLAARRGRGAARRRPARQSRARRRTRPSTSPSASPARSSARRCGAGAAACSSSTPPRGTMQVVSADGPEWQRALELLAAAEPDAAEPGGLAASLGRRTGLARRSSSSSSPPGSSGRSSTACSSARSRAAPSRSSTSRRRASPDAPRRPEPELLRLQAAGVPVAVVRQGDDLASRAATARTSRDGACVGRDGRSRSALPRSSSSRWRGCASSSPSGRCRRALALLLLAVAAALPARPLVARRRGSGRDRRRGADRRGSRSSSRGASPVQGAFGFSHAFSTLGTRFGNGFDDFYSTHLPFDPRVHVAMHELVLSGVFVFALGVALLVAARKPVAAALVLLLGAGWPATLLGPSRGIAMGAAILGGAARPARGPRLPARAGARLSGRRGRGWRRRSWSARPPRHVTASCTGRRGTSRTSQSGRRTWGSCGTRSTAGSGSPGIPRLCLQVQSAAAPTYLRATVLDDFRDNAWAVGLPRSARFAGACGSQASGEPDPADRDRRCSRRHPPRRRQHPDARSWPPAAPRSCGRVPGFAALDQNLPQGFRYTAWSYTRPAERGGAPPLAAGLPAGAGERRACSTVGDNLTALPFGFPRPDRRRAQARQPGTRPSPVRPARAARGPGDPAAHGRRTTRSRNSSSGSSRRARSVTRTIRRCVEPPLVGFVTRTHAGYCQYFAGAMALMLRYLGIPARVAVGFAGGTYDPKQHVWNVSDREAHAWVEVWFKGYGWLPFDPTPAGSRRRATRDAGRRAGGRWDGNRAVGHGRRAVERRPRRGTRQIAEQKLRTVNGFGPHRRFSGGSRSPALSLGSSGNDRRRPILLPARRPRCRWRQRSCCQGRPFG